MPAKPPLQQGAYYHVYNRGLNKSPLFTCDADFLYFLKLMHAYLTPVSDVLSYAIMQNHYHIALRVKTDDETGWLAPENAESEDPLVKWATTIDPPPGAIRRKPQIQLMLSHLLASYAKWFNYRYRRTGKLFEERHERKIVESENHLRQLIVYINRNPEHHRVTTTFRIYPWISYHALVGDSLSWVSLQQVFELFDGKENFICAMDKADFDDWLRELEYGG